MRNVLVLLVIMVLTTISYAQYPTNEEGQYADMLTPEYYNSDDESAFRLELDKFIFFARKQPFAHPLEDSSGQVPTYTMKRGFGDGIGFGGTGSHHPAFDYYVGNSTDVNLYAAHDGRVSISRDVTRYRHYLSITTDVQDSSGNILGKLVTFYAHIDLDLDTAAHLFMDGQLVKKGDVVSKHLYSGTVGGPHLHFEIRYYRASDTGFEDFYGGNVGGNTSPSSGSWTYGYWNPSYGYGFAHPLNHINNLILNTVTLDFNSSIVISPNPTKHTVTVKIDGFYDHLTIELFDLQGRILKAYNGDINHSATLDLVDYPSGVYVVRVATDTKNYSAKIIKE